MKRKIFIALAAILLIIQFIRPAKNISQDTSKDISKSFSVPADVSNLLQTACNDCHSNNTHYPWYSYIQPVYWWLDHHIDEGKGHLNFSEFSTYSLRRQYHKFEEIQEMVKDGEMPLSSYTITHRDAILSDAQKASITQWAGAMMDTMKAHYPIDSLVRKRQ
jgi:hypothetical protein